MDKTTAPYRFVDYSTKIFYPPWGEQQGNDIRFDMPYRESQSGEITIELTAKSPIFVGDFKDDNNVREFFQHNGSYYIPGSSIKGMIRRIAAILSFSKMSLEDRTLSYRDLNNPSYKKKAKVQNKIFMGWLYQKSKKWFIQDVGKFNKNNNEINCNDLRNHFGAIWDDVKKKSTSDKYKIAKQRLAFRNGTIVFTGAAGKKNIEFIFPNSLNKNIITEIELTQKQIQNFKEAYYIGTPNESKDWKKQWSERFEKGEKIPVFFQKDSQNKIIHFGLSKLYKLPYENSIGTLYKNSLENFDENKLDFVERIFGFVKDDNALKGRISFSHFKALGNPEKCKTELLILSTPRPTFYPYYLKQTPKTLFKTYDNEDAKLSGFKFYAPRHELLRTRNNNNNNNIATKITALKEGTKFIGKIRYFNLRKEELGLLLLSLTFLKDEYFYKIGGAKPYGYGDCHLKLSTPLDINTFIESYVNFTKQEFGQDPCNSTSAKQLLEVSKKSNGNTLRYLELKEFANIKSKNQSEYGKKDGKKYNKGTQKKQRSQNKVKNHMDNAGSFNPVLIPKEYKK